MTNLRPRANPDSYAPLVRQAGQKILALCHERNLTIADVEEMSGISHVSLGNMRNGKSSAGIITYLRLCDVLGIPLSALFDCSTPVDEQMEGL